MMVKVEFLAEGVFIAIPSKYAPLAKYVGEMIRRMEESEPKYGDWTDIDSDGIREHLEEEYEELARSQFQDVEESIDLGNLAFMNWAIWSDNLPEE